MFTNRPPGIFTGLPEISACSLAKAMFEPQKEIEPMIAAKTSGMPTSSSVLRSPPSSRNSAQAMSATAPPPTPLNSATICGIAVIFTLRAAGTPMTVPIDQADRDEREVGAVELGVQQRRDDRDAHADGGDLVALDGGRRARELRQAHDEHRERDDVRRGDEVDLLKEGGPGGGHVSPSSDDDDGGRLGLLLEHAQHAVGDEKAADDVDRAERDRDDDEKAAEEARRRGRSRRGRRAGRCRGSRSCPT